MNSRGELEGDHQLQRPDAAHVTHGDGAKVLWLDLVEAENRAAHRRMLSGSLLFSGIVGVLRGVPFFDLFL